ncbi:MAG: TlpA disulfide reductase family protein [Terriglobales bacterium]
MEKMIRVCARTKESLAEKMALMAAIGLLAFLALCPAFGQKQEIVWSADEKPVAEQIHGLRALPDDVRAETTRTLAIRIRQLPATENKLRLAFGLANLSTEGDFGHAALQEVAATLAETLKERPVPWHERTNAEAGTGANPPAATTPQREPAPPYVELASLVRYEHVDASLNDDQYHAAMARLEADDRKREHADFTLKDLNGKSWSLSELRGKVVVVNFWATWCPPCRKEMPDLEALYERFGSQGLVILGISDEEQSKVAPFVRDRKVTFPILLDPGRKVNEAFIVEGIPKSFVYDRDGKLVAQSIDMRTQKQFLEMLASAGLH